VVEAWHAYFDGLPDIEIVCDDFANQEADGLVAPANSFGRMDGGLDAEIIGLIGEDAEAEVQRVIQTRHEGELVVGLAEVVITDYAQFPFLVVAPTMRVPQNISRTANAYLAFRAALRAVRDFNALHGDPIGTLLVPGLGTANGFMPPLRAARQMRAAYDTVLFGLPPNLDISLDAGADSDDKYKVRPSEASPPG
jgi:O-acetyl-ADP-ribose deacetylase (regulator of RNase III)